VYNKRNIMKLIVVKPQKTSTKGLCEIYEIRFLSSSWTQTNHHNKNYIIIQFYEGRNYTWD